MYHSRPVRTNDASATHLRPLAGRRVHSREVGGFVIAAATYRADARTSRHSHELGGLAIVLDGGYVKRVGRAYHDCGRGTLTMEPPGVTHAETYGRVEVRAVLIELLPWRFETIVCDALALRAPLCVRSSASGMLGRRLWRELRASDSASSLVLEGLALESVAVAYRATGRGAAPPAWLGRVVERLRDEFRSDLGLTSIAASAGVHVAHLARVFRAWEGCSIGEFVRHRRIEWAAGQLATSAVPIAVLARDAGFCDQSHFTRVFMRQMGVSPARYRAAQAG